MTADTTDTDYRDDLAAAGEVVEMAGGPDPLDLDSLLIDTGQGQGQGPFSAGDFISVDGDGSGGSSGSPDDANITDLFRLQPDPEGVTPCGFITGRAGCGKTTLVRACCQNDPSFAVLSSSTGISAINLNTVTIHSLLGFFDTDSLRDAYISGAARRKLKKLAEEGYRNIVIDEVSMISKQTLDILVRVFDDTNMRRGEGQQEIGLILTGDFGQLPAIADDRRPATPGRRRAALPTPWCFESDFWPRFERNLVHLKKVWRQADPRFLAALDFARAGRGGDCLDVLRSCSVKFESGVDMNFRGTTVVGKNDDVDRLNQLRLDQERGRLIQLPSRRWAAGGRTRQEWKHVPERTLLKEGCYVMILANKYSPSPDGRDVQMVYANGDCGWVRGIQGSSGGVPPSVMVELVRTGEIVNVESLVRSVDHGNRPDGVDFGDRVQGSGDDGRFWNQPHYRKSKKRWVVGQMEYYPLRLAYASTCHKAQGLSLDNVQIDFRGWMWGNPSMLYVGLSRARTLGGLRLVGMAEMLVSKCKTDQKVVRWL